MGATCVKIEPPARRSDGAYRRGAYGQLHEGVKVLSADQDRNRPERFIASWPNRRPASRRSAPRRWKSPVGLETAYRSTRAWSQVAIVGAPGERAEEPGHDLTHPADNGLVTGLDLPPTPYADMGGLLMAAFGALQVVQAARRAMPVRGTPSAAFSSKSR